MTHLFQKIVAVFCLGSGLFRAYGADDRLTYLPDTLYQVDELIPSGSRAEAEDNSVTSYGCKLSTTYPGYSGSGYIEMGGQGSWMSWDKIDGGPGGTCTLSIRFSNGSSGARQCVIKVNGVAVQTLGFMPTGSWSTWKNAIDVKATLKSGMNSVRIEANTASGGPCIDSLQVTATSPAGSPNAQYSYSTNDKLVQFSDKSIAPSGVISSWHWDFGDGTTSNQNNPSHTYTNYGIYHVSLLIIDNAGNTNTRHQNVDVRSTNTSSRYCNSYSRHNMYEAIGQIQIGFYSHASGVSSYSDFTSEAINLSNGSSYSVTLTPKYLQDTYVEYWSIWADLNGNGSFTDPGEQLFTAAGNGPVVGTITIPSSVNTTTTRMRISMKCNANPAACEVFDGGEVEDYTIMISSTAPSNSFIANFTYSVNNQTVTFMECSTAGPGKWIDSYLWSFGDTQDQFNIKNPTPHTYFTAGTYNVCLTVYDNTGDSRSITKQVTITNNMPTLIPDFAFNVTNQTVFFTDSSSAASVGVIYSYSWEFGDNTYSNDKNPSHTYNTSGTYSVRLTVSDNTGNRKSIIKQVVISSSSTITANFSFDIRNQTVSFTDSSIISGGSITNWSWQFGDGATANQQNTTHTYSQNGSYSVQLTVIDNNGRSNSITKQIVIVNTSSSINSEMELRNRLINARDGEVITLCEGTINIYGELAGSANYLKINVANSGRCVLNKINFGQIMSLSGNGVILEGITFQNGNSHNNGGGLALSGSDNQVINCSFINNTSGSNGGGLYTRKSLTMVGSTFYGNKAMSGRGGAVFTGEGLSMSGNTGSGNYAAQCGDIFYSMMGSCADYY